MFEFFLPAIFGVFSLAAFGWGILDQHHPAGWKYGSAFILAGLSIYFLVSDMISSGTIPAWINIAILIFFSLLACMVFALKLHAKMRFLSIGISLTIPIFLILAACFSYSRSPDAVELRNRETLVQWLFQYQTQTGHFPQSLDELVLVMTAELPSTRYYNAEIGWLYRPDGDNFSLGYVSGTDRFGYWITLYQSQEKTWSLMLESDAGYHLPPTPTPALLP